MFSPGDWIVHSGHGIGQIVIIEEKSFGKKNTTYYRIETDEITLWVPVGEEDSLRFVSPPEEFSRALEVLQRPSRHMSTSFNSRCARIRQARAKGTPLALARIIRDLWARQQRRGKLSNTEGQALRDMIAQLLAEWSITMEMDESQSSEKLFSLLRQNALPAVGS